MGVEEEGERQEPKDERQGACGGLRCHPCEGRGCVGVGCAHLNQAQVRRRWRDSWEGRRKHHGSQRRNILVSGW